MNSQLLKAAALWVIALLGGVAQAQMNDMQVYTMSAAEQAQLSTQASRFMGQGCVGGYGQLIYPMGNDAMAVSMVTELGVNPRAILGSGPKVKGEVLKYSYAVGQNAEGRFALRLKRGGPVIFQYYRSTTRNGQPVVIKQACTLR